MELALLVLDVVVDDWVVAPREVVEVALVVRLDRDAEDDEIAGPLDPSELLADATPPDPLALALAGVERPEVADVDE